jgi:hypothetical protein
MCTSIHLILILATGCFFIQLFLEGHADEPQDETTFLRLMYLQALDDMCSGLVPQDSAEEVAQVPFDVFSCL